MTMIDQRLFELYCAPILQNAENFDEAGLERAAAGLPLTEDHRRRLLDIFFDSYRQWSLDAFAAGLHLGLSLSLGGDVRGGRSQQLQQGPG